LNRELAPPSGWPPPIEAKAPGGRTIDLLALAREVCRRYRAEYADEQRRYGDVGVAWCVHDNQHILNWAILAAYEGLDLRTQVSWLARILEARDFPLDRLARDLELAADVTRGGVVDGDEIGERLAAEAAFVRSRPSFLAER
jgi:hypothetical protein